MTDLFPPGAQFAALEARLRNLMGRHGMGALAGHAPEKDPEEAAKFLLLTLAVVLVGAHRPSLAASDVLTSEGSIAALLSRDTPEARTIHRAHGWLVRLVWVGCRRRGEI